jgi:SAM-dependent methyltransferase
MRDRIFCRACGRGLRRKFVDLGTSPLANAFLRPEQPIESERRYPLCVYVCESCLLVQLPAHERPEAIFDAQYAYFSSYSDSWLKHAQSYADRMISELCLGAQSLVVEVASNDGYLLRWFRARQIPVLGIEPTANTAAAAMAQGIPTRVDFFGVRLAEQLVQQGYRADLIVANNVLAHVPDLHDFVEGFRMLLRGGGTATLEFPHVLQLIEHTLFDTIYHEHFSYLSLLVVERVLGEHDLVVHRVEELPTHGGSLRVHVSHRKAGFVLDSSVAALRAVEKAAGLHSVRGYTGFAEKVLEVKADLLEFLVRAASGGKKVVGYGAPAKGNTLLNYCGVGRDLIPFTVDRSPHKQGLLLPGVRIPVRSVDQIDRERPDYLLILPWNLEQEIIEQMARVRSWGCRFVLAIPRLQVL